MGSGIENQWSGIPLTQPLFFSHCLGLVLSHCRGQKVGSQQGLEGRVILGQARHSRMKAQSELWG